MQNKCGKTAGRWRTDNKIVENDDDDDDDDDNDDDDDDGDGGGSAYKNNTKRRVQKRCVQSAFKSQGPSAPPKSYAGPFCGRKFFFAQFYL